MTNPVGIKLIDRRDDQCVEITGEIDSDKTLCCGLKVIKGSLYCSTHSKKNSTPNKFKELIKS